MKLDLTIQDYQSHLKNLRKALEENGAVIYLDACTLLWLVRIATAARNEFIHWCRSIQNGEVIVPVWAAHEFHYHIAQKRAVNDTSEQLTEIEKSFNLLKKIATERADDSTCSLGGFSDRADTLNQVDSAILAFGKFKKALEFKPKDFIETTNKVIEFMNERILDSNIDDISSSLFDRANFRYQHRIPPGFRDAGKPENSFGDLVIWEEILRNLKQKRAEKKEQINAILVTFDHKTDWVTSGLNLLNKGEKEIIISGRKRGLDGSLPHPMLVHELGIWVDDCNFQIVHPNFLAETLGRMNNDNKDGPNKDEPKVTCWLAVSSPPQTPKDCKNRRNRRNRSRSSTNSGSKPTKFVDLKMVVDAPLEINAKTTGLNAQQREHAINSRIDKLDGPDTAFSFGKTIARMSCDFSDIRERIVNVLGEVCAQKGSKTANDVLLALLVHVYFESDKILRRFPQMELGRVLLFLEANNNYEIAFQSLCYYLKNESVNLPYYPGGKDKKVIGKLDSPTVLKGKPRLIRELRINDCPVLSNGNGFSEERSLSILLNKKPEETCTTNDLKMMLEREYLIPSEYIFDLDDFKNLTWKKDAFISRLDTQANSGIGLLGDEESYDD